MRLVSLIFRRSISDCECNTMFVRFAMVLLPPKVSVAARSYSRDGYPPAVLEVSVNPDT